MRHEKRFQGALPAAAQKSGLSKEAKMEGGKIKEEIKLYHFDGRGIFHDETRLILSEPEYFRPFN